MRKSLVVSLIAAATCLGGCADGSLPVPAPPFIKGMSYAGYTPQVFSSSVSDALVRELQGTHTEWLIVIPQWYQDDLGSHVIAPWPKATPTDASVRHVIRLAHSQGMKVILKPFVDPKDSSWRAQIQPDSWPLWFKNYTRFIVHYADMARQEKVEGLTVGVEYSSSDVTHTGEWRSVIRSVRQHYPGLITYAADWPQYQKIRFWRDLDAIGIDAYFPLSGEESPSLSTLKQGWQPWIRQMRSFAVRYPDKKVLFTEIGYTSRVGSARDPSQYHSASPPDPSLQARLYQATFESFIGEKWLLGYCWFWWDNPSVPDYPAGPRDIGYTPRGKPAQKVLTDFFGRALG